MNLRAYRDSWRDDDPHANFKAEVACYTAADPMPTIENLSKGTGIPVDCLIRYVLVKYAASGSEALMAMEPIVFRQMREHVARAEGQAGAFPFAVDFVEALGADTLAHGSIGKNGARLTARLPGNTRVGPGDALSLVVPAEALHLFDAKTGQRI